MHLLQTNHSRPSKVCIRHYSAFVPLKATARFVHFLQTNHSRPSKVCIRHFNAFVPLKEIVMLICAFVANLYMQVYLACRFICAFVTNKPF